MNLSIHIFGGEAYHQSARIRPWLGTEILQVLDSQACFFLHFAMYGFFQTLSCLHETSHERIEVALEVAGMNQEHLVALPDEHDDGGGEGWPYRLATFWALLADVGIHLHRSAANAAVLGVCIPIVEFLALSCLLVKLGGELVEARAQTAHLVFRVAGHGLGNGEGFHFRAIAHRGDIEDVSPGLELYRTLLATWNRIGSVFSLLEQDICLAKYKPILYSLL